MDFNVMLEPWNKNTASPLPTSLPTPSHLLQLDCYRTLAGYHGEETRWRTGGKKYKRKEKAESRVLNLFLFLMMMKIVLHKSKNLNRGEK